MLLIAPAQPGSSNGFIHPMHIHGARYQADTLNVAPGQRCDVIWTARTTGKWLIHCHIAHHTMNNNVEMRAAVD